MVRSSSLWKINNMKNNFCCDDMSNLVEKYDVIEFVDYTREYDLVTSAKTAKQLRFCPFCGKELGESLNSEYYGILFREYGIEYPEGKEADKVPPEFKSDEWWRKRGLQLKLLTLKPFYKKKHGSDNGIAK